MSCGYEPGVPGLAVETWDMKPGSSKLLCLLLLLPGRRLLRICLVSLLVVCDGLRNLFLRQPAVLFIVQNVLGDLRIRNVRFHLVPPRDQRKAPLNLLSARGKIPPILLQVDPFKSQRSSRSGRNAQKRRPGPFNQNIVRLPSDNQQTLAPLTKSLILDP